MENQSNVFERPSSKNLYFNFEIVGRVLETLLSGEKKIITHVQLESRLNYTMCQRYINNMERKCFSWIETKRCNGCIYVWITFSGRKFYDSLTQEK